MRGWSRAVGLTGGLAILGVSCGDEREAASTDGAGGALTTGGTAASSGGSAAGGTSPSGGMGGDPGAGSAASGGVAAGGAAAGGAPSAGGATTSGGATSGGAAGAGGAGGEPTPCQNSLDCVSAPADRSICDPDTGRCEQCLVAADCPPSNDCLGLSCVPFTPCASADECTSPLVCDMERGRCVVCTADVHCAATDRCIGSSCRAPCTSDRQCTPMGLLCDTSLGRCVSCVSDAGCVDRDHCSSGECRSDQCAAGSSTCLDGAVATCTPNGSRYEPGAPCGARETCTETGGAAICASWVCSPGTTCASSTDLVTCSEDGLAVLSTLECPAGQACIGSQCRELDCAPGQAFCAGQELRLCSDDGLSSTLTTTCLAHQYCDAAAPGGCPTKVCTPDALVCSGNSVATCNSQGSALLGPGTSCAPDHCVSGACRTGFFAEDFEDGDSAGWTVATGIPTYTQTTGTVTTTTAADGSARSFSLTTASFPNFPASGSATRTIPASAPSAVSFWLRVVNASGNYTGATFSLGSAITVGGGVTGTTGMGTPVSFGSMRWHHFELRDIDWVAGTYSAYVNGVLQGQGITFVPPASGTITTLRLDVQISGPATLGHSGASFWDEILLQ